MLAFSNRLESRPWRCVSRRDQFIDDCADGTVTCCMDYDQLKPKMPLLGQPGRSDGVFPRLSAVGMSFLRTVGHNFSGRDDVSVCQIDDYWAKKCNDNFGTCNGNCKPFYSSFAERLELHLRRLRGDHVRHFNQR